MPRKKSGDRDPEAKPPRRRRRPAPAKGPALRPERVQPRLSPAEIEARLVELPDWRLVDDGRAIMVSLRFVSTSLSASFASLIASLAELAHYELRLEIAGRDLILRLYGQRAEPDALAAADFDFARAIANAGKVVGGQS